MFISCDVVSTLIVEILGWFHTSLW